jgi:Helix-turn-helix domain
VQNHAPDVNPAPQEAPAAPTETPAKPKKPRKRHVTPPPGSSPYLTVPEVAQLLRTTPKAIYRLAERERIRVAKKEGGNPLLPGLRRFGGRLLVRRDLLVRSLEKECVLAADSDGDPR